MISIQLVILTLMVAGLYFRVDALDKDFKKDRGVKTKKDVEKLRDEFINRKIP